MLTELDLAKLCQRLYDTHQGWDFIWEQPEHAMTAAIMSLPERDVIVCEGSHTPLDWIDDAISEVPAIPIHPQLGEVPAGFYAPLPKFLDAIIGHVRPSPVIIGHSLGGARAVILGAMFTLGVKPPSAVVAWGCPRPGTATMAKVLNDVPVRWYDNAPGDDADKVCTAPRTIPKILPWQHIGLMTRFQEPAPPDDPWGPLRFHHFELYMAGTAKLDPMPTM